MSHSNAKSPRSAMRLLVLGWLPCILAFLAGCHSAPQVKHTPSGELKVPLPAHALRFLRLAGYPYEGWESSGPYLDTIQLYFGKGERRNGSIGFTDELIFHFFCRLRPFGKELKPVQSATAACERVKTLLGNPSGYRYSASRETYGGMLIVPRGLEWMEGKAYYDVAAINPQLHRTYTVMIWADSGAVFILELVPRPPRTMYNSGPKAPPGY